MEVSFSDAARMLGMASRSTLYRWHRDGWLARGGFLRGEPGSWRIETHPEGQRPFTDWALAVIGPQGPQRQGVQQAPEVEPSRLDVELEFWAEYGRIATSDEPPLSDAEHWQHTAAMVSALMGKDYTPAEIIDLAWHLDATRDAVVAGARWDATRWDEASARSLLEDPEVVAGTCRASLPELQRLAHGGRLSGELQAAADAALAAYGAAVPA